MLRDSGGMSVNAGGRAAAQDHGGSAATRPALLFAGQSDGKLQQWTRKFELHPTEDFVFRFQPRIADHVVYSGHRGPVTALAVSTTPKALVFTGSADRTIKVWDPFKSDGPSRANVHTLLGHGGTITSLALETVTLRADEPRLLLISSSTDRTVRTWMEEENDHGMLYPGWVNVQKISTGDGWVSSLYFSRNIHLPDDGQLYTGDTNGAVRSYGVVKTAHSGGIVGTASTISDFSLQERSKRQAHAGGVTHVHHSRRDNLVLSMSHDFSARMFDATGGSEYFRRTNRHGVRYTAFVWNPDNAELFLADELGYLTVWDIVRETLLKQVRMARVPIVSLDLLNTADLLVVTSFDQMHLVDVTRQELFKEYKGHKSSILGLAYSMRGAEVDHRLYSASLDGTIRCWSPIDLSVDRVWTSFEAELSSFHFVHSRGSFVTGHADGSILLWSHDSGSAIILEGHRNTVTAMAIANIRGHDYLLSVSFDGHLIVWNLHRAATFDSAMIQMLRAHKEEILCLVVDNERQTAFTAGNGRVIKGWDTQSMELRMVFKGHTDAVTSLAMDGNFLFSTGEDMAIRVWDTHARCLLRKLTGHSAAITDLLMLPDGLLATCAGDLSVRLWDYVHGTQVASLSQTDNVTCMTYRKTHKEIMCGTEEKNNVIVLPVAEYLERKVDVVVEEEVVVEEKKPTRPPSARLTRGFERATNMSILPAQATF